MCSVLYASVGRDQGGDYSLDLSAEIESHGFRLNSSDEVDDSEIGHSRLANSKQRSSSSNRLKQFRWKKEILKMWKYDCRKSPIVRNEKRDGSMAATTNIFLPAERTESCRLSVNRRMNGRDVSLVLTHSSANRRGSDKSGNKSGIILSAGPAHLHRVRLDVIILNEIHSDPPIGHNFMERPQPPSLVQLIILGRILGRVYSKIRIQFVCKSRHFFLGGGGG